MDFTIYDATEVYYRSRELTAYQITDDPDKMNEIAIETRDLIKYHEWRYYVMNDPLLTDFEFDQLYTLLKKIENRFPQLQTEDSPTNAVGSDITENLPKVRHNSPMLSLANSYNREDLVDFEKQIKRFLNLKEHHIIEYTAEPKFDGGSIAVVYEQDTLSRAATRGNGEEGDDITANSRFFEGLPHHADFSFQNVYKAELRGEALIRKDRFVDINQKRAEEGLPLFANPRNTATGGLRMKDPLEAAERGIEVFIYQLGYAIDNEGNDVLPYFDSHYRSIAMLGELGIKIALSESKLCRGIEEVLTFCNEWEARRDGYPYELDGMVIKVDSRELQERVGYTAHHPRWAIAYKFKAKQASSRLQDVEFQVGKTGAVTPVAKIDPVALAGVTISSISLHNEDFIKSKDIRIGDIVMVERAGDVIPYISESKKELRIGTEVEIRFPIHCPSCEHELFRPENEAAWRCVNVNCNAQVLQKMIYHVSKEAMDIDGLGKSLVEKLYTLGMIKTLPDIYRLDYSKLKELEGLGDKSVNKLKEAIDVAKRQPLHRLLCSLSIHHLGKKASKLLAMQVKDIFELRRLNTDQLTGIKDIGPVLAENVVHFFADEKNISILEELRGLGVNVEQSEEDRPKLVEGEGVLNNKTILFTGTLISMSRKEAQELAERSGARNISAVSSNLDILVAGEKAGSKLSKAQTLGTVTILTEEQFMEIIRR